MEAGVVLLKSKKTYLKHSIRRKVKIRQWSGDVQTKLVKKNRNQTSN